MTYFYPSIAVSASDPLLYQKDLPDELWDNIFAQTGFWDQVAISRVSNRFRNIVSSPQQLFGRMRLEIVNQERLILRNVQFKRKHTGDVFSKSLGRIISTGATSESDDELLYRLRSEINGYIAAMSKSLFTHGQVLFRQQRLILRPFSFEVTPLRLRDFGIQSAVEISNFANPIISESALVLKGFTELQKCKLIKHDPGCMLQCCTTIKKQAILSMVLLSKEMADMFKTLKY